MRMGKVFNVTGNCNPELHYMVDITEKLVQIKEMVDGGQYFTINRARQYGKTTVLKALDRFLRSEYYVVSLDFQYQMSHAKFSSENAFSIAFAKAFTASLERAGSPLPDDVRSMLAKLREEIMGNRAEADLVELFWHLSAVCGAADKPIVLMIDEVDSAANNQVFLDFLAQLRGYYLNREEVPAFWSVILAGVYDVKNIKRKIRQEEDHKRNSPWNIAADFDVAMSLPESGIREMLCEYEKDWAIDMDTEEIAGLLYAYTSGYPYLVSRLCKLMDEKIAGSDSFPTKKAAWTKEGFLAAVRVLLSEENTLFESLDNKLIDYPELKQTLKELLLLGKPIENIPGDVGMRMAVMFGFAVVRGGFLYVANRIFETRLYNSFLSEESRVSEMPQLALADKSQFVKNGRLDMDLVLRKFVNHYTELFGDYDGRFLEDDGRRIFLLYLRPIINGTGNYYIESRTRNNRRTDVIIDFQGQQAVVELKIWRGNEYHSRGEEQLSEYLDYYHLKKGYMVSFNFNKKKEIGVQEITLGDKILVEAVV